MGGGRIYRTGDKGRVLRGKKACRVRRARLRDVELRRESARKVLGKCSESAERKCSVFQLLLDSYVVLRVADQLSAPKLNFCRFHPVSTSFQLRFNLVSTSFQPCTRENRPAALFPPREGSDSTRACRPAGARTRAGGKGVNQSALAERAPRHATPRLASPRLASMAANVTGRKRPLRSVREAVDHARRGIVREFRRGQGLSNA